MASLSTACSAVSPSSTVTAMPSTPSSAPLTSHQTAAAATTTTSSAAHAAPYSAPPYASSSGSGWGYRSSWAHAQGPAAEAPPSITGANTTMRPGLRTIGYTDWVEGPDGRLVLVPGAAAAAREANEAAWKAAGAATKKEEQEDDDETEEEVEAVGPTPEEIVVEFKRAGHFDSLRKELLSSFTSSPLLPSMQSFVEGHLLTLLASSQERRARLAGLDKRLQNMEMCKEIEDNTDLMRRVVDSVRGTGEGLVIPRVKEEGEKKVEIKEEPGAEASNGVPSNKGDDTAASSTASATSSASTALLSADSRIGVSLVHKVQELIKAERERHEDNEAEENSEAEGKNTPRGDESVRNGSMTPATPAYPSSTKGLAANGGAANGGGSTPITAAPPTTAPPKTTSFAEAPTVIEPPPAPADDEGEDMDMD